MKFKNYLSLSVAFMLVAAACSVGASQQPSIEVALKSEADIRMHLIRLSEVGEVSTAKIEPATPAHAAPSRRSAAG